MQENEIGAALLKERELKKYSITKVCSDLNMQKKYIEAMEKGNFEKLPGEAYVRVFLKTYGEYLGLNGGDLVEEYKKQKKETIRLPEENLVQRRDLSEKRKRIPVKIVLTPKLKIGVLSVLGLVLLTLLVTLIKSCVSDSVRAGAETKPETSNMPRLLLEAEVVTGDCWFQISKDNEAPVARVFVTGEKKEWTANENFYIKVGDKNNIKLTFNGKPVPIHTYKSEKNVVTFTLSREENKSYGK